MAEDLLNTCFGEGVAFLLEPQKICRMCYNTACSRNGKPLADQKPRQSVRKKNA